MEAYLKYFTPQVITFLTSLMLLLILLVIAAFILIYNRNSDWAKKVVWLPKQFILMYSDKPSILGKKRVESGIAFFFVLSVNACFMYHWRNTISFEQFMIWSGTWLFVAGWVIKKIQDEKLNTSKDEKQS